MIKFLRKGSEITAQIEANVGVERRFFQFTLNLQSEVYACLLRDNFSEKLRNSLKTIREEAYVKGWKDAKAKTAKETWFSGSW